ncbi:MAG: hypothetical protein M1829_001585 [Trizodia sp. TS-e1964]|nr:MAG: hypothetical protein M1829_001585 [Trizodia sp. TS-e1964]
MSNRQGKPASVEDWDTLCDTPIPDTRRVATASTYNEPASASTARRRSGLSSAVRAALSGADGASDSGYSSHHTASADSRTANVSPPMPKSSAAPSRRRPALEKSKTTASSNLHSSPIKTRPAPLPYRAESPIRPSSARGARKPETHQAPPPLPSMNPLSQPWDLNYPPFAPPAGPPRPPSIDPTAYYASHYMPPPVGVPIPRPRIITSQSYRAGRPMSYHGGGMSYIDQGYSAGSYDRGPPPSASAYSHASQYPPPSFPPPSSYSDYSTRRDAPPLSYEVPRSSAERWAQPSHETYSTRPVSSYGTPVVQYDNYPPQTTAPSISRRPPEREKARLSRQEDDFNRMPPPSKVPARHSAARHSAHAAMAAEINRATSVPPVDPGSPVRDNRGRRTMAPRAEAIAPPPPRRPSTNRRSKTYANANDSTKMTNVESKISRRASNAYGGSDFERDLAAAKEYQQERSKTIPLTTEALLESHKVHNALGSDSGSMSRASKTSSSRGGSEAKTRSARSGSGVAFSVPESDDGFTMRFPTSQGIKIDFLGNGMEGRSISLKPGENGEQELCIGSRSRTQYLERSGSARDQLEYARSGGRRSIEDRMSRDGRSNMHSRRASRSTFSRVPLDVDGGGFI